MRILPMVNDLRSANWAALNPSQRLDALQRMENELAAQQGRNACKLATIDPGVLANGNNGESLFGQHKPAGIGPDGQPTPEAIEINPALLADGKPPYTAAETYFHEARHSWQAHVAKNPELAESDQQFQDFYKAQNGGYLPPPSEGDSDVGFKTAMYRCQPTELDANRAGQTDTAILYEQAGELDGYLDYQNSPDYESQRWGFAIENTFKDKARELVDLKYRRAQQQIAAQQAEDESWQMPAETECMEAEQQQEAAEPEPAEAEQQEAAESEIGEAEQQQAAESESTEVEQQEAAEPEPAETEQQEAAESEIGEAEQQQAAESESTEVEQQEAAEPEPAEAEQQEAAESEIGEAEQQRVAESESTEVEQQEAAEPEPAEAEQQAAESETGEAKQHEVADSKAGGKAPANERVSATGPTQTPGPTPNSEQAASEVAGNDAGQASSQAASEAVSQDGGDAEATGASEDYDYGYGY